MHNNFVERYSGMVESKKRYTIDFEYHLTKLLSFNLGYSYIDWNNAGFDPFIEGNQVLENLIKKDIYLNINYSFNEYEL